MKTLLCFVLLAASAAFAGSPAEPVNRDGGAAIRGYDPVGYFTQGKPVKGAAQFSTEWMGATWWFANAADRDAFSKEPQKYAPQYGGYCAWAVGHGYTAPVDPEAWKIINGKLYLNYSKDVQKNWLQDPQKWINSADQNWPGLHK